MVTNVSGRELRPLGINLTDQK